VTSNRIDRATLKSLGGVLFAGAIGGVLFWIIAKWTGTSMPAVFGLGTVLVLMFVGALAAAFGVYLLTASDLNAIRTYVFAVICGLAWQPMIASAQRIAANATTTSQNAQVGDRVAQIKAATSSGNIQQISAAVQNSVPAINEALNHSTGASDTEKKAEIISSSKLAINEIESSAIKAPDVSVDALKNISLSAGSSGQSSVAMHAIESLHTIGGNAQRNNDKAVAQKVEQSLNALAAQSRDSSVQAAARTAASQLSHDH